MAQRKTIQERLPEYENIRQEAQSLYSTYTPVECQALGQKVNFNSNGFNHLVYEKPKKMRDKLAQILRFDMLPRARKLVEISTTYQEYEEELVYKKVNRNGKWVERPVLIKRWGLIGIIQKFRIKVVLIQEGNGGIQFLSVIPAWFTKQYKDIKMIVTSTGKGLGHFDDLEVLKNATKSDDF